MGQENFIIMNHFISIANKHQDDADAALWVSRRHGWFNLSHFIRGDAVMDILAIHATLILGDILCF